MLAYKKARKNKTSKWYVKKFEKELERNIIRLESELRQMTYKPHPLTTFIIRDPKTRTISSSHFRDRVVYHAICNVIEPIFEPIFIFDSFKRKASGNGRLLPNAENNNCVCGYVLKADIKHYFDTVDHKVLWLIGKIVDNFHCKVPGKGMPIGNLTSQFFANVYLNELDYFVKHDLRAKYYIRYLDDFVILHKDRHMLENWKIQVDSFLKNELKLELHPDKSKIYPLSNGIKFLGFRVFHNYKIPKKGSARRIKKRIEYLTSLHSDGLVSGKHVIECIDGWNAYAMHGNTYTLRKLLIKNAKKLIKSHARFNSSG